MIPRQVSLSINTMGTSSLKEKGMLLSLLPDVNNKIEDKNDCTSKICTNVYKFAWINSFDIHLNTIYHSSRYLINMFMYHNFKCVLHVCINRWTIEIIAYFSCLHRSLHHEGYKVSD